MIQPSASIRKKSQKISKYVKNVLSETIISKIWYSDLVYSYPLISRYINVNGIVKHIKKLFFIENKKIEKFIRNLLIETMILKK